MNQGTWDGRYVFPIHKKFVCHTKAHGALHQHIKKGGENRSFMIIKKKMKRRRESKGKQLKNLQFFNFFSFIYFYFLVKCAPGVILEKGRRQKKNGIFFLNRIVQELKCMYAYYYGMDGRTLHGKHTFISLAFFIDGETQEVIEIHVNGINSVWLNEKVVVTYLARRRRASG